jgi:flagellar basal body-associated protein FliL
MADGYSVSQIKAAGHEIANREECLHLVLLKTQNSHSQNTLSKVDSMTIALYGIILLLLLLLSYCVVLVLHFQDSTDKTGHRTMAGMAEALLSPDLMTTNSPPNASEAVKVVVRIRPLSNKEIESGHKR